MESLKISVISGLTLYADVFLIVSVQKKYRKKISSMEIGLNLY